MPDSVDNITLELIERRLADRVTASVRTRLFALYATIGVVIGAVLGYVGLNVFDQINKSAVLRASEIVTKTIEPAADAARVAQGKLATEMEVLARLQDRAQRTFDKLDTTLAEVAPKAAGLDTLTSSVTDLEARMRNVAADLQITAENKSRIDQLSAQLSALATQVASLAAAAGGAPETGIPQATSEINKVATSIATSLSEPVNPRPRQTTVFVQFAGIKRENAEILGNGLRQADYSVPGEERTATAAGGLFEVRYFWGADKLAAEQVAKSAQELAQKSLNDARLARVVDYTNWPNTKPRQGSVELWYSPP